MGIKNFEEFIQRTENLIYQKQFSPRKHGYKYGRGWSSEVYKGIGRGWSIGELYHYGTCILKWKSYGYEKLKEILYFKITSVSDLQGINKVLPTGMWGGSWNYRWGHFISRINGIDINTIDAISDNNKENQFLCMINDKVETCSKLSGQIHLKSGKYFHIGNNSSHAMIRVISNNKNPFKYKRCLTLWKCKKYNKVFPLASSLDGSEVHKIILVKTEEAPEGFVNKCIARLV